MLAMISYIRKRGNMGRFLFVDEHKRVISRKWLTLRLHDLIKALGLSTDHYNTHSLRIGACTHWAAMGDSVTEIRLKGRWKSFAFTKYLRPDEIQF